jgi:hypothetical protein
LADIQIDAAKAERMIAQILRDEKKLLPADANALATTICRRLSSAMATPTNQPLQGYRIIRSSPPIGGTSPLRSVKRSPTSTSGSLVNFGSWFMTAGEISLRPWLILGKFNPAKAAREDLA